MKKQGECKIKNGKCKLCKFTGVDGSILGYALAIGKYLPKFLRSLVERSCSIFGFKQSQKSTKRATFRGLHNPEHIGNTLFRNVGNYLPVDTGNTAQNTGVSAGALAS
jgi:hypothetical protein